MEELVALSSMLRARQLSSTNQTTNVDNIPNLTRSLPQVHSDSTKLLSSRSSSKHAAQTTSSTLVHPAALRLFASVGFEVDTLRRAVSAVDATPYFIDLPVRAPDPHRHPTWLAPRALDEARLSMNAAIRDAAKKAAAADLIAANETLVALLSARLDRQSPPEQHPAASLTPRTPASARTARRARTRSDSADAITVATVIDERYVEAVRSIALHGDAPSAPFLLHEVAASIPDSAHLVESLAVLASIARHSATEEKPTEDMTVWGARVVLEDQFAENIPGLPQKPRLAAPAAVLPAVERYVRDLHNQGRLAEIGDAQQNGYDAHVARQQAVPLWPQMFFCMRVGNVKAALLALQAADRTIYPQAVAMLQFCRRFLQGRDHARMKLRRSRSHLLASDAEMSTGGDDESTPMVPGYLIGEQDHVALYNLYKKYAWSSKDPYLRACIVLLLRLELLSVYGSFSDVQGLIAGSTSYGQHSPSTKHQNCSPALSDSDMSQLFGSVEDYMWLRLWLCRTPIESDATAPLSEFTFVRLKEVQEDMLSCGSSHFDPDNSQPLLYTFVLICCGLYDEAVASLATHADERMMQPAAHIAITLYHLKWSKDYEACHSVLMKFVSIFSRLFPVEAALYLMTVRDRSVLQKLLAELVVTTGEYTLLLGAENDRENKPGALHNHLASASVPLPSGLTNEDISNVRIETALQGAIDASERGEYSVAADLYELAGKRLERMDMIMRNLADVVDNQGSSRRPLAVAQAKLELQSIQDETAPKPSPDLVNSIKILLGVATVFEEYWTWRFGTAWDALRRIKLLPLTTAEISNCRRNLTGSGEKYDDCIHRCGFEVLKVALHIAERALELGCIEKASQSSIACHDRGAYDEQPQMPDASEIKTLCIFAGLLRISEADVSERLVRIELLLSS